MKKINIAELLKDCPKGMELNCILFKDTPVYLHEVITDTNYPIEIKVEYPCKELETFFLNKYGAIYDRTTANCVIFPKGKTTWEGFVPPCKFKDGDICYIKTEVFEHIFIFKVNEDYNLIQKYINLSEKYFYTDKSPICSIDDVKEIRLATEEEKTKLFDAIKANGYKWNTNTKTLEKLIEPKFKVGDEIVKRNSISNSWIVSSVSSEYYGLKSSNGIEGIGVLSVSEQDNYEILPKTDKFDVTNFEPFMKVLVRSDNSDVWECDIFSLYNPNCSNKFHCIGAWYNICIPYIGNEHLRGTTNDCDEFYKTWE